MIAITVWRDVEGGPRRLQVKGHAGQGPYGSDIVCAAASALVETLLLGIRDVTPIAARIDSNQEGLVDLTFPIAMDVAPRAVVETILYGLEDLSRTAPRALRWNDYQVSEDGEV